MELFELTIEQAKNLILKKEISSLELILSVLDRIDRIDKKTGSYITVAAESAVRQAKEADAAIEKGHVKSLTGIPIAVKDLICTKGIKTTCASRILENFIPPYDATVISKLKDAGAVIIGKTNMDEFAMGSTTENSGLQTTRNPWDLSRIPGGSSGGSAVAVAADLCSGAIGSDTGGSIRQPASHCGVVGLKPTYGRVSRFGLIAFASSLDQIGPITKDVKDSALLMNAISGYDPKDSTSVNKDAPDYTSFLKKDISDMTIGIPIEYKSAKGLDNQVSESVSLAIETIKKLGAKIVDISLPHTKYAVAAYYVIAPSEASSNLARYDGVKYGLRDKESKELLEMFRSTRSKGFGPEVKRRIIIGTYCLSSGYFDAYYKKASQVRTLIIKDFEKAFQNCDVIVSPVSPEPAFKAGEVIDDPLSMYLSDIFTLSANLAGIPGISVPCGFSLDRLPIGLQIMGAHFNENLILKAAWNFEQATKFHLKKAII